MLYPTASVLLALCFLLILAPPAHADEFPVLSYLSTGYRYRVAPFGAGAGFEKPDFDDASFSIGDAAFGTRGSSCPLGYTVKTQWSSNSDLLLRKWFQLPANAIAVKVAVAIDNDVQVFFNGVDISGGPRSCEQCASRDGLVFPVPDNFVIAGGDNLLAVRARDRGTPSYCDVEVRAGLPQASDPRSIIYTLRSGNNDLGGPDSQVWVQGSSVPLFGVVDSGLPLQSAFVVARQPNWGEVSGATWVSPSRGGTGVPEGYQYFTLFVLPPGFKTARLDVVWRADDAAELAVNDARIQTPWGSFLPTAPPGEFHGDITPLLRLGFNRLQFFASNARVGINPTGVSFFAKIILMP